MSLIVNDAIHPADEFTHKQDEALPDFMAKIEMEKEVVDELESNFTKILPHICKQ